jgi:NAD(P) transhydrogenase subunit alpha
MDLENVMSGLMTLHVVLLAAFGGWLIVGRSPEIIRESLVAGCTFLNGIVSVAGLYVLLTAGSWVVQAVGFFVVLAATAAAMGGYTVLARRLRMFRDTPPAVIPDRGPAAQQLQMTRRRTKRVPPKVVRAKKARSAQ